MATRTDTDVQLAAQILGTINPTLVNLGDHPESRSHSR